MPAETLPEHLGLFGQSGTGKSFMLMSIGLQLVRRGYTVWIIDVEDEHSRLLPLLPEGALIPLHYTDLRFSFFQTPGPWVATTSWNDELGLLFRSEFFLRDGSLNLFGPEMTKLLERKGVSAGGSDWPSLVDVIGHFAGLRFGPKTRHAGYIESLLNRLFGLANSFEQTSRVTSSTMLPSLAQRSVIFRFPRLTGTPLQFLTSFLLLWLARDARRRDALRGRRASAAAPEPAGRDQLPVVRR